MSLQAELNNPQNTISKKDTHIKMLFKKEKMFVKNLKIECLGLEKIYGMQLGIFKKINFFKFQENKRS